MTIKYLVRTLEDERFNYIKREDDRVALYDSFAEAFNDTDEGLKGFVELIDLSEEYVIFDENDYIEPDEKDIYVRENYHIVNMYEILNEINRDRSEEWTDYDQRDFIEGLEEWTDWTLIGKLERIKRKCVR